MFMFKKRPQYAQIVSEEQPEKDKKQLFYRSYLACVLMSVLSVSCLIVGLVVLIYHGQRSGTEDQRDNECGASLAEFESNGCVFDVLSYTWMPARCKDQKTSEEFLSWLSDSQRKMGPWPFFKVSEESPLAENRISNEVEFGKRLGMDIWSSREEHLAHCLFMFLHASRVAVGETPLWTSASYHHAEHCFHAVWKGLNGTWNLNEERRPRQKIEIGFSSC